MVLFAAAGELDEVERLLDARQPDRALARLDALPDAPPGPKALLAAEAWVQLGPPSAARRAIEDLRAHRGYDRHADALERRIGFEAARRWGERTGLGLFALALAALVLGGAGRLLSPTSALMTGVLLGAVATGAAAVVHPPWTAPVGMLSVGGTALGHAAAAARARLALGPRLAVLAVALVGLGFAGQLMAIGARCAPVRWDRSNVDRNLAEP